MSFVHEIRAIYERHPKHIVPFVGEGFTAPSADRLRVMCVGINAYVSARDWDRTPPESFAGWIERTTYKFGRAVLRDASIVGEAITRGGALFHHLRYAGHPSLYVTNAVKVYVPEEAGKRADQLGECDYERHVGQWQDELRTMRAHGVLPHVIVIFGWPF